MKPSKTTAAEAAQTPVFPQTLHHVRLRTGKPGPKPQPQKRDNIFSNSRDTREDRGERQMKTSHNAQNLFHAHGEDQTMNTNPLKQGLLTENSSGGRHGDPQDGPGAGGRSGAHQRACGAARLEIRLGTGQTWNSPANRTWTQKERPCWSQRRNRNRWDPLPGSSGHLTPAAPGADEDEEGRSDNERLVDEGIAGAEQDQMRQAASAERSRDL